MIASWQESYDKPRQCVEKQRHYSADKGPYSQGYGLFNCHIWLWELEHKGGRVLKNWCFQTVVLDKTPESPWTARESNQFILKKISPKHSLEGLMLKLKLQYFGQRMRRTDSLEKFLLLGKIEGRKRRGRRRMGWLDVITNATIMNFCKLQEMVRDREAWHFAVHGVTKSWVELSS